MEELTKQVSKMGETLNKVLENQEFMKNDISKMKQDISGMQGDISGMKGDILSLKQGQKEINKKIDKMYFKLNDGIETARVLLNQHKERIEKLEAIAGI